MQNLAVVLTIVMGLLAAVFLGNLVGDTDVRTLFFLFLLSLGILYVLVLHRYVWQISLLFIAIGFGYAPRFKFGPLELTCALGLGVVALFVWQRRRLEQPGFLKGAGFVAMQRLIFVWLLYVALHFLYNYKAPFRPGEYVLENAVKSYFTAFAPFLMLYCFSKSPLGIRITPKFFRTIGRICLVGVGLNLVLRLIQLRFPGFAIAIPILNAGPNGFLLRTAAPFAMLLGSVGLTSRASSKEIGSHLLWWLLLGFGLLGSGLSGGRGALVLGFGFVAAVLMLRRKYGVLTIAFAFAMIGAVVANLFSNWINSRADPFVQRSLQWVLIEKSSIAEDTIVSSSKWRQELAMRALDEWQSHPRIFWFGRATYGYGVQDEVAMTLAGGYESLMQSSLRRGATHNLVTDLLVAYGLIGAILYFAAYLSIVFLLWKLHRSRNLLSPAAADLTLVSLVSSILFLLHDIIGGTTIRIDLVWYVVILLASLYRSYGLPTQVVPAEPSSRPLPPAYAGKPVAMRIGSALR